MHLLASTGLAADVSNVISKGWKPMPSNGAEPRLELSQTPVAKTEMLIRKPVAEVFAAFVDPTLTSRFWFTKGSAPLAPGAQVRWDWELYGFSTQASVLEFVEHERIVVEWAAGEHATTIEWRFTARADGTTFVSITNAGYQGTGDERVAQALGSVEGFTFVLAGAKALLEHGIELNLVADRFPDGIPA
jgi:uncharacterized protein YndB with AHSA1/START domain